MCSFNIGFKITTPTVIELCKNSPINMAYLLDIMDLLQNKFAENRYWDLSETCQWLVSSAEEYNLSRWLLVMMDENCSECAVTYSINDDEDDIKQYLIHDAHDEEDCQLFHCAFQFRNAEYKEYLHDFIDNLKAYIIPRCFNTTDNYLIYRGIRDCE